MQAWKYGPVIPEIYHEFKDYGRSKITQKATKLIDIDINTGDFIEHVPTIDTEEEKNFVKLVWDKYKKYTGIQLSNSTHVNDTPWDKARSKDQNIISDLDIQEYYEGLMKND